MKRKKFSLVALLLISLSTTSAKAVFYVHDSKGNLGVVNVATRQVSVIGNMGVVMTDIAFDRGGNLFGLRRTNFYRINPQAAESTLIGRHSIPCGNALEFSDDGTLFGAGCGTTSLFTINTTCGVATAVGNIGVASVGDLAFNNGNFYVVGRGNQLVSIDLSNGAIGTQVGPLGFRNVFGLDTDSSTGALIGFSGTRVLSINTSTGAATLVFNYRGQNLRKAQGASFTDTASQYNLVINDTNPIIPKDSRVQERRVLTRSDLALNLTLDSGQPAKGVQITLQSDRGGLDMITDPKTTDTDGIATAQVETRNQPGPSTLTSNTPNIRTVQPASITWLPADYEKNFLVTCYVLSNEADFVNTKLVSGVCGLPPENQYHKDFLEDIKLQGSGIALNGETIQWSGKISGKNCYRISPCPQTASGVCAQEGVTVAVDPNVIPLRSSINVAILKDCVAQDTGGRIKNYRIDEYMGINRAACKTFGKQNLAVQFLSY